MTKLRLKIAAWIAGGTVHTFEGCDGRGKWHLGKIIVTPEAMNAFRASFRTGATVYADTALTDREIPPDEPWTQSKADMVRLAKGGPSIGDSEGIQANGHA